MPKCKHFVAVFALQVILDLSSSRTRGTIISRIAIEKPKDLEPYLKMKHVRPKRNRDVHNEH